MERAGFVRSTGNTVWWGASEPRVEMFAGGGRGWQVDLAQLEAILLDEARHAGVEIDREVVHTYRHAPHDAAFVLDCSGHTGLVARALNVRRYHDGPKTVALVGEWRGEFELLEDQSHTAIESYRDGWMWSVPVATGVRHVSAMIDPQRSDLARGASPRDIYLGEIEKTSAFRKVLATASFTAGPLGWDASTYSADQYCGDAWLLVGDAGSFIDPLSSAGVKKALASAWLAAVVVNTSIRTPAMARHALDFFSDREREIERHHAEESRAFLAGAARAHDRPFWSERSNDTSAMSSETEAIIRAYDGLRQQDHLRVRIDSSVLIEPRPIVEGHEIRLASHVSAGHSPAIRFVNGVNVVSLLELAPHAAQVPELYERYVRQSGEVPLHDFLMALSTAVARGWLVRQ